MNQETGKPKALWSSRRHSRSWSACAAIAWNGVPAFIASATCARYWRSSLAHFTTKVSGSVFIGRPCSAPNKDGSVAKAALLLCAALVALQAALGLGGGFMFADEATNGSVHDVRRGTVHHEGADHRSIHIITPTLTPWLRTVELRPIFIRSGEMSI